MGSVSTRIIIAFAALFALAGCGGGGGSAAGGAPVSPDPDQQVPPGDPLPPLGLRAEVRSLEPDRAVDLRWDAEDKATEYVVESYSSGSWNRLAVVDAPTYSVTQVAAGLHRYRVRAANAGGASLPSDEVSAMVPPGAPSNLQATTSGDAQSSPVVLTWDSSEGAEVYRVFASDRRLGDTTGTSFTDAAMSSGRIAYFYVIAVDTDTGAVSPPSEVATEIEEVAPPAAPAGLVARTDGIGPRANVSLAWLPTENADRYIVMRGSQQVGEIGTAAIVDRSLGIGVHSYSVAGLISSPRVIGPSSAVAVTVAPAKPAGLQATPTGAGRTGDISLTWDSVDGAAGYRIYIDGSKVADVSGLSHAHEDLAPGVYALRVVAYANGVSSRPSDEVRTGIAPAAPPAGFIAKQIRFGTSGEVALAWDPVDGAQGFRIYRDGTEIATTAGTSHTDSNLGLGSYTYQVAAYNFGGKTQPSTPVNVQVRDSFAAPAGLVAQTDGIGPGANVSLAWSPIASADRYIVTRGSQQIGETGTAEIVDRNLGIGVHAYSVAGLISSPTRVLGLSSAVAVTVAPAKPAGLQATPTGTGRTGDIALTWTPVDGAAGYQIYLDGTEVADVSGLSHAHEDPGPGAYAFRVAAYANGVSSQLSDAVRTGVAPAAPPAGFIAWQAGFGIPAEVALAWDPVDGAQGFRIYRDGAEIATTADTRHTDINLGLGSYTYQVAAYNLGGQTQPSIPVNVQVKGESLTFGGVQDADGNYEVVVLPEPAESDGIDYTADPEYRSRVLSRVGADQAYQRGYFGQGVTVAIVGSGFNLAHPELADNILAGLNTDDVSKPIPAISRYDEGSIIAGSIGGVKNGVGIHGIAPSVTMMPYHFTGGGRETIAFKHAIALNIPIISNGWIQPLSVYGYMTSQNVNATINLEMAVGPELLAHPSCKLCRNVILPRFAEYAEIARDKDVVFVFPAGDQRWGPSYYYGKQFGHPLEIVHPLDKYRNGKYGFFYRNYGFTPQEIIDGFTILPVDLDEESGFVDNEEIFSEPIVLATLDLPQNSIDSMAAAPSFQPSLLGKWVAVVGVEQDPRSKHLTHGGCGSAKYYCMVAPKDGFMVPRNEYDADYQSKFDDGTVMAAAFVSGALALMKSRYPDMPMHAILAIIFHTAQDWGEPGIDDHYGRGMLDVGAAITAQGTIAVVLDEPGTARSTRTRVAQTQLRLPPVLSRLASRAQQVSVAVDFLGGSYYDMPLDGLFKEPESWRPPLGQAAANMLAEPAMQQLGAGFAAAADLSSGELLRAAHTGPFWKLSYDKCRDCAASGWREYRSARIAAPFFDAGGEAAIGEIELGQGWSAFAAAGFAEPLDGMRYSQLGARWQAKPAGSESWATQLELSRSDESDALLGGEYSGALAVGDASTYQARILGELALGADWTLAGSYLAGWTEGATQDGSMIAAIGTIRFAGWRAYLEGRSLLYADDALRLGFVRQAAISDGSISFRRGVVEGDPVFSDEHHVNLNAQYAVAEDVLELDQPGALVAQVGYAFSPRQGMRAAVGLEHAGGSQVERETAASFELRWEL